MAVKSKANEIHITRVYDAPVEAVWDAWTDPTQVGQWWGPRGFTLTTHSRDLRVGGHWHYTMHGPDGTDYPNKTVYHEVEKHKKLVYDHGANDVQPPLFRVTVLFSAPQKGRTQMDMTMALATAEQAAETRKFIIKAGGNATWDRLAEHLEKQGSGAEIFIINRTFDAPIERMWQMWTDPAHFAQWLAPKGFDMKFIEVDIREGGSSFYVMASAQNNHMYGRAEYMKVEKPHLLLYRQQFTDLHGNVSRHPMAPTWPETMETRVQFTAEDDHATRVTVTWRVVGAATREEIDTFTEGRAGMTMGWSGSFDKLENYLSSQGLTAQSSAAKSA